MARTASSSSATTASLIASSNVVLDGGAGNDWLEFNGDPNAIGSGAGGARYFDLAVFDAGDGDDQIFIHALGSAVILAGAGDDTSSDGRVLDSQRLS